METPTPIVGMKVRDSFIKVCTTSFVKEQQKEAKRVGYKVVKDDMSFKILDPDYNDALVMKGIQMQHNIWGVTFPFAYWVEPAI